MTFIPLLAPKSLEEFSPSEFKEYVRGLKKERRKKTKRVSWKPYKLTARLLKKGTISLKTKRSPAYITPDELGHLPEMLGRPENEIFLAVKEAGLSVLTHQEAKRIQKAQEEIPWT